MVKRFIVIYALTFGEYKNLLFFYLPQLLNVLAWNWNDVTKQFLIICTKWNEPAALTCISCFKDWTSSISKQMTIFGFVQTGIILNNSLRLLLL